MVNANKLLAIEFFTINAFFIAHTYDDIAYFLACLGCGICGISARMILLYKNSLKGGSPLTKSMVVIHLAASIVVCWFAVFIWRQGIKEVWPFHLLGLPLYIAFCSFSSMFLLEQLDKASEVSIGKIFKNIYEKWFMDGKSDVKGDDNL